MVEKGWFLKGVPYPFLSVPCLDWFLGLSPLGKWSPSFFELAPSLNCVFLQQLQLPQKSVNFHWLFFKLELGRRKSCWENFVAELEMSGVPWWKHCTRESGKNAWIQVLPGPLCCVTLDKPGALSGPEFPHVSHLCHAVTHYFFLSWGLSCFCKFCLGQNRQVLAREGKG